MNKSIKIITTGTSHGDPTYCRFNASTLLDIPGYGGVLADAGTPVLALLIRQKYDLKNLRAIFITHMHQDHFGGLPDILKYWVKRMPPEKKLQIFLPENVQVMETIFAFTELAHRTIRRDMFEIFQLTPGSMTLAEDITVNAVATDHFSNEKKDYPSFALHFSCGSKSILCAGDLSADFHDFPSGIKADIAMCELTHFHLDRAIPRLREEKFGKLIFTHIGNGWHGEEAEKNFAEMVKALPYPAVIAHDGDVFEL